MARTVLLVDDHDEFRAIARTVLEADGFEVIAEAADGEAAVAECERARPDIVVLDVLLPDANGFDIARKLVVHGQGPIVVLISSRDARAYSRRLESTPAHGFLPKRDFSGRALRRLVETSGP
jgi:DNA-binding NarL/FixJ family response regulator